MNSLFLSNLTSPPLLFFFLGAVSVFVRSDLEIPTQVAKSLSLYLLLAIGFKGGAALAKSPLDLEVFAGLGAAVLLAVAVPLWVFVLARRRLSIADAAALAATYGSISAVTFVASTSYLDALDVPWGGHLVAAMALMESPAIVVGLFLHRSRVRSEEEESEFGELLREALFNGSVFLLVGSMVIGAVTGARGVEQVEPLVDQLFLGVLCVFLLDMGIVAARRLRDLGPDAARQGDRAPVGWMLSMGLVLPVVNGAVAAGLATVLGLAEGDALLLVVLGASASYIAVPAAMRLALPEANPSLYLPMSLAITFPFNLIVGIPVYHQAIRWLLGS